MEEHRRLEKTLSKHTTLQWKYHWLFLLLLSSSLLSSSLLSSS